MKRKGSGDGVIPYPEGNLSLVPNPAMTGVALLPLNGEHDAAINIMSKRLKLMIDCIDLRRSRFEMLFILP